MPDYKRLMKKRAFGRKFPRERKQKREILRLRRLLGKGLLLLMLALFVGLLILAGRSLLRKMPHFKIKQVVLMNHKGEPVSMPDAYFSLALDDAPSLFNLDLQKVAQDIRAGHPELTDVSIRKQFPHRLLIIIKEREPIAIIALGDSCLVDQDGFILPFQSIYKGLPKIVGINPRHTQLYRRSPSLRLKKALKLIVELEKAQITPEHQLKQIDVRKYSDLTFYLEGNMQVKMGRDNFSRKAAVLSEILTQLKASDTLPKYIDMRFDNPVVKP